jgi:hypothetical protein
MFIGACCFDTTRVNEDEIALFASNAVLWQFLARRSPWQLLTVPNNRVILTKLV